MPGPPPISRSRTSYARHKCSSVSAGDHFPSARGASQRAGSTRSADAASSDAAWEWRCWMSTHFIARSYRQALCSFGVPMAGSAAARKLSAGAMRCRRKFLRFFPGGFADETYIDWERGYKWAAHEEWMRTLHRAEYKALLNGGKYDEIAARAVRLESRTNLLFSFEKMALRDAVRGRGGAKAFAEGLFELVYGRGSAEERFEHWIESIASL